MSEQPIAVPQWHADTSIEKAREIQRLAELKLEDIAEIAASGDGRAATLAAAMSAIAAALLVGALTVLGFNAPNMLLVHALLGSTGLFIIAAGLAIYSAKPTDFGTRGYAPDILVPYPGTEFDVVKWSVEQMALKIDANNRVLMRASRFMTASYITSGLGVALPLITTIARLLYR